MLGCHSGGRLLALLTTSMKLSLASTDSKAAAIRVFNISDRINELKDEEESLSREMEMKELEAEKERHMAFIDYVVATKLEDLSNGLKEIKHKIEWLTEKMKTCDNILKCHADLDMPEIKWTMKTRDEWESDIKADIMRETHRVRATGRILQKVRVQPPGAPRGGASGRKCRPTGKGEVPGPIIG